MLSRYLLLLLYLQQVGLSPHKPGRKVRATQSTIFPNGKLFVRAD